MADSNFYKILHDNFMVRRGRNPRYSLRAFAKSLNIDHSTLSQILRGKRNLTKSMVLRLSLSLNLKLTDKEIEKIVVSAEEEKNQQNYHSLSLDTYAMISDWYHHALYELMNLSDFKQDFDWIAKTLRIEKKEAHEAFDRLQRLGLIEVSRNGRWRQKSPNITTVQNDFTTVALKNSQKSKLRMAEKAIDEIPFDRRDNSAMMMSINSKRIPEVKMKIKAFRRELCDWLQKDKDHDCVYELATAFFPITEQKESELK